MGKKKRKINPFASTGKLSKERWNKEGRGRRQKHKLGAGGKEELEIGFVSRSQTGAACVENPISHTERRSFIGYKSFRRLLLPSAKVNTHRRVRVTRHQNTQLLSVHIQMTEMLLHLCLTLRWSWKATCRNLFTYIYLLARKLKLQNVPVRSESCKQYSRNSL